MADWTDKERATVASVWGKIDVNEIGPQALARYGSITSLHNLHHMHIFV